MTVNLSVDVIVAVHNACRPVERAVASALYNSVAVRVTVVAHNVSPDALEARLDWLAADERVRILPLTDGVRSPANAFNHGLDAATAEFVSIVGSDDELEPGALDAWTELALRTGADAVIAPILRAEGGAVPRPRIRRRRFGRLLDIDRDRVFERTAPLGLQRRVATMNLRYAAGLPRGVDHAYGLRLWSGHDVVFAPSAPAYIEHADQNDRVTHTFGPLADDFAFLEDLYDVFSSLTPAVRRAVVAKILRMHLIPAVRVRQESGKLSVGDLDSASALLRRLSDVSLGARGLLPQNLYNDLEAIERATNVRGARPTGSRTPSALIPIDISLTFHRHAPLRQELAGRAIVRQTTRAAKRRGSRSSPGGAGVTVPRIVVLAPHGSPDADRIRREHEAVVIGWIGDATRITVPEPSRWSTQIRRILGRSFCAQVLLRLLAVDEASQFSRAVFRTTRVRQLLEEADLVIAVDAEATFTAWRAWRRWRIARVVSGYSAGREAIANWSDVR